MHWFGSTVLVTGASRGVGRCIAKTFASKGALVGLGYNRFAKGAEQTLDEIRDSGGNGILVRADVSKAEEVDRAIKAFLGQCDGIDVLVNNAAIVDDKPFALMTTNNWKAVLSTNLDGVFNCTRAAVRSMMARRKGVIVNISSVAGINASPGQVNYSASKGGVMAMTRTLATELAPKGIRVNSVVPGFINEGMALRMNKNRARDMVSKIPLARFGDPEEVAHAVLFLASDKAGYITGQQLVVDGGLSL